MNINEVESIMNYLESARCVGHTKALIDDIPRSIVTLNVNHIRGMSRHNQNVKAIQPGEVYRLYGRMEPVVFDNQVVYELCQLIMSMEYALGKVINPPKEDERPLYPMADSMPEGMFNIFMTIVSDALKEKEQ